MSCGNCRCYIPGGDACCPCCGTNSAAMRKTSELVGSTGREFFNPTNAEWFRFGPRQTPPAGWKPLLPVPARDPYLPAGSTVTYIPGQEPQLFVDPATGTPKWIYYGDPPPGGWKPLIPRLTPPPLLTDAGEFFDPATGECYSFPATQTPPSGWKPLLPVPPRDPSLPSGSTVTYIPGEEPRLFVDPSTGNSTWVYYGQEPPAGWKPLQPRASVPPLTGNTGGFFNPQTGESYIFGPKQTPPVGWKPLTPIPPAIPGIPPGSTVTFIPGQEPKLFVDPNTGNLQWVYFGQQPPSGWKPLIERATTPPLTTDGGEFFNPATGEWYRFGPALTPPEGWKPMQPLPPVNSGFPPGTTVTYIPGREPRLFVDPATGNLQWVYFGEEPPAGGLLVLPRYTPPAMATDTRTYFDPATGAFRVLGAGATPPAGWIKLKPIPAANPCLPPGATVTWIPGMQPRLYVNPQTGDVQWVAYNQQPPQGWLLLGVDSVPVPRQATGESEDAEWLRSRRLIHLITLAREQGVFYTPQGDLAHDKVYEAEMARLGYERDSGSLSGWIDIPPSSPTLPQPGSAKWLAGMGPLDRLYWALEELIRSGKLGKDFYDALPDPHAFVLGLLALVVLQFIPGIDLVLDAFLVWQFGSQIFDLADALSAMVTADSEEDFRAAVDDFGKALSGIALDTIVTIASWGLSKWRSTAKPPGRGPQLPKGIQGLDDLTEAEQMRINGGARGGRSGHVHYTDYYPEPPRGPRGRQPPEQLPYDMEPTERSPASERGRSREYSLDPHDHHTFPKYLGGEYEQAYARLRPDFHELYHRELDLIAPRRGPYGGGSADYEWLKENDPEEFLRIMRRVVEHTRDFDQRWGTNLLRGLLRGLRNAGISL